MSLSGALSNALTGLTASARSARVVSDNIANVMTDGYAPRSLTRSPISSGSHGGVQVTGIHRNVDQVLLAERRDADSAMSHAQTKAGFLSALERLVPSPDKAGSLSSKIATLEASLVTAASQPQAPDRLHNVVLTAQALTESLNTIADRIQAQRSQADQEIALAVDSLNSGLNKVENLNQQIATARIQGQDSAALEDLRQSQIDKIAIIVPIQEIQRDHGQVALITHGGSILVDGPATEFSFSAANYVTSGTTLENGMLSGLSMAGRALRTDGPTSTVSGGTLAALFELRDETAIVAQSQLDALARDLTDRLGSSAVDMTLGAGQPGLFTDAGAMFDPANEIGYAARISVNALVDPDQGGDLWRLRAGLGATQQGDAGNATILLNMRSALGENRVPASGDFGPVAKSAADIAGGFASDVATRSQNAQDHLAFVTAVQAELKTMELSDGVDTDFETQQLLMIEQAYAANARMITVIDDMMQTLLRI